MKKFTFALLILLVYAGFTIAQTIENFEPKFQMNVFSQGTTGSVTTVANPDPSTANPTLVVGKMHRAKNGDPWMGFWFILPTPVDATANKYLHLKIWKPRVSPVVFKYEKLKVNGVDVGSNSGDVKPMTAQALTNQWEELVFDMTSKDPVSGLQYKVVLIPDFPAAVGLTEDIDIYFDEIYVNNDPAVGSAAVQKIADFEYIKLNMMFKDPATDLSTFTLVTNPDKSGGNASEHVIKFIRDKDGQPWGGFWSALPVPIDVTTNHFVHVRVWKPRLSPLRFKLEGGPSGTKEFETNTQTKINQWEDIVFDVTEYTGAYPVIAFMPDRIDPVGLTEDITIYFDDIIVNNDPNPRANTYQILNINMAGSGITAGQKVFHSGTLGGDYGNWNEPGANMKNEMTDPNGDGIFTDTIYVNDGSYEVRFYKGETWANGDPANNRIFKVKGGLKMDYSWGLKSANLTLNVDMHGAKDVNGVRIASGTPIYVSGDFKNSYGDWDLPGTNKNCLLTDADGDSIYTIILQLGQINTHFFKFYSGNGWSGKETADFDRELEVTGDMTANYIWGSLGQVGVREKPLAGRIQMYPNPVRDELTINATSEIRKVIITNTVGKVVGNINYSGSETISTSSLSKGMYFVTFVGRDGNKVTQKLIKD